jgi:hypothetical protein
MAKKTAIRRTNLTSMSEYGNEIGMLRGSGGGCLREPNALAREGNGYVD